MHRGGARFLGGNRLNMNGTRCRDILAGHGFPETLLAAWDADGIQTLLPIQQKAIDAGCLDGASCLVVGPTSSGKTFVGELVCARHALTMRPSLYLVPFKALAEEKYADFQRKYGSQAVGADVLISTADRRDQDRRVAQGNFTIAILTYEKLAALLVSHPALVKNSGALVIDEIQMISDPSRGAELELLITRIRQIAPQLQIIGLSAVVAELNGFDGWLNAKVIEDHNRPVLLREGVIGPAGSFKYIEWLGCDRTPGVEGLPAPIGLKEEGRAVSLTLELLKSEAEQILVFANTVAKTQEIARAISAAASWLPAAKSSLEALNSLEATASVDSLVRTLARSVAFHNADLTIEERLAVERGFRSGEIRCVVATSTLSMGINMPASTVIIVTPKKWARDATGAWQEVPVTVAEYRNMSGRAGRFGARRDELGRSVLIAGSPLEQDAMLQSYARGHVEPLVSAFLQQPLDAMLLRSLASGLCASASGSCRFLLRTFAAKKAWNDAAAKDVLRAEVDGIISLLERQELVTVDAHGKVVVTPLGQVCAASGLTIDTFIRVARMAASGDTSPLDVALIASNALDTGSDAVSIKRPTTDEYKGRMPALVRVIREANTEGNNPLTDMFLDSLPTTKLPDYDLFRPMKYQAIAIAFVCGLSSRDIENRYGVSAGRARAVGSNCSWLCDTAAKVAWVTGRAEEAKNYEILADRFLHGCSEPALLLAQVPHSLHRAEREQLVTNGFTSLQKIVDTAPDEIARAARVNRQRVILLQAGIVQVLGESLELERQQLSRLRSLGVSVAPVEALYTMKGTLLEQAVENLLAPPFCPLTVSRIASQREGEADLKLLMSNGRFGIAQVTARERPTDRVALTKAGAVLQQSPELSPEMFICFGRPGFMDDAVRKAASHVDNGTNYKLIPLSVLAEMFVRFHEGGVRAERVAEILERETGYVTLNRI